MRSFLLKSSLLALLCVPSAGAGEQSVEVLRDPWGIPHIFADTDTGAFRGLGYATAEDRAFQMTYSLRVVQGRLAEVVGDVRQMNRNDTSVDHDRKMRTFGFHRAAQRTASRLDPETLGLPRAYCDGVNAYFREHRDRLHPLFAQTGVQPEPWTPADCLASWWHLAQFFATDGTRDLIAGRNEAAGQRPARAVRGQPPGRGEGRPGERPAAPADLKPMHDPNQAQSILPIGQSEWPDRPARTSTLALWGEGRLHPAPLSREKVETLARSPGGFKRGRSTTRYRPVTWPWRNAIGGRPDARLPVIYVPQLGNLR